MDNPNGWFYVRQVGSMFEIGIMKGLRLFCSLKEAAGHA